MSNRVSRRQAGRWARHDAQQQQQQDYEQQQADAPEDDAGPPADDMLAQLERLGDLKDRGVLSEAEFAEQKRRILSA